MTCSVCGTASPDGFRYCGTCGERLRATAEGPPEPARAEHRHLTVMFCDLVGSTALSGTLDPEEWRDLVRRYQAVCVEAIERVEGHVAQYLGDGLLVYFGYPVAHDEDARRAVTAALEIAVAVPGLDAGSDVTLGVRIGLHTGDTVTGEVGAGRTREQLALGETPNIAARLQGIAPPNGVVLSDATYAEVKTWFDCRSLGTPELKGVRRRVEAFQALRPTRVTDAPSAGRAAPLVGREAEIDRILEVISRASLHGEQTVLLRGEPGIGKSRLLQEVRRRAPDGTTWHATQCSPFFRHTFLHPWITLLNRLGQCGPELEPAQRATRLRAFVGESGSAPEDVLPWLESLLGIGDRPEAETKGARLPPEVRRQRTMQAVTHVLRGLARRTVTILALEDLHWADASSLELLGALQAAPTSAPLVLLLTTRPDLAPGWPATDRARTLELGRLAPGAVPELVRALTGRRELPSSLLEAIIDRAAGVPLFVEELVRTVFDAGMLREVDGRLELTRPLEGLSIPTTIHGSLMARLDRLGAGKDVAQRGAVLGREFSLELLRAVVPWDAATLDAALSDLVQAAVLSRTEQQGDATRAHFEFTHALVQETAYASLLKGRRQQTHGLAAHALEERFPGEIERHPELAGHHWARALKPERAVPYLRRAGDRSAIRYANDEAIALYREALTEVKAILRSSDEEPTTWLDAFGDLQEAMGDIMALIRRQTEAQGAYRQALAQTLEREPLRAGRLYRKMGLLYQQDREAAHRCFVLAEAVLGPEPVPPDREWRREWVHVQLGKLWVHYWYDEPEAMEGLVRAVRPYIDDHATGQQRSEFFNQLTLTSFRKHRYRVTDEAVAYAREFVESAEATQDVSEICSAQFTLGFALLFHGSAHDALTWFRRALESAERSGNRTIAIRARVYLGVAHRCLGQPAEARAIGARSLAEAVDAGMVEYVGMAHATAAWVALQDGSLDAVLARGREALARWRECEMVYPFQWAALLPMMVVHARHGEHDAVVACARAMLVPGQQQLAEDLGTALGALATAREDGPPLGPLVEAALAAARDGGYLAVPEAPKRS